jgi:integrase
MPLNAKSIATLPEGWHLDSDGLYLKVEASGSKGGTSRRWVLRATFAGRRREFALGALSKGVTLALARDKARSYRELMAAGRDPKAEERANAAQDAAQKITFGQAAELYLGVVLEEFKNPKHRAQWRTTLMGGGKGPDYCAELRKIAVGAVVREDVEKVLRPMWRTVPETASRLRQRIERVLSFSATKGWRSGPNPAAWEKNLEETLRSPPKVKKDRKTGQLVTRGHQAAIPYADVPAFYLQLSSRNAMAARVLQFIILTGCRSGEARGADWSEFNLSADIPLWTVPFSRMKAGREHVVPLSLATVQLLKSLPTYREERKRGLVFATKDKPLSDSALSQLMRTRMGVEFTAHGMRSAFRDYLGEETIYPRELAEHALAHNVGSAVEQAYARGKQAKKRAPLMADWAAFVTSAMSKSDIE